MNKHLGSLLSQPYHFFYGQHMPSFLLPLLGFDGYIGPSPSKWSLLVTLERFPIRQCFKMCCVLLWEAQEMILADEYFNFNYHLHGHKV